MSGASWLRMKGRETRAWPAALLPFWSLVPLRPRAPSVGRLSTLVSPPSEWALAATPVRLQCLTTQLSRCSPGPSPGTCHPLLHTQQGVLFASRGDFSASQRLRGGGGKRCGSDFYCHRLPGTLLGWGRLRGAVGMERRAPSSPDCVGASKGGFSSAGERSPALENPQHRGSCLNALSDSVGLGLGPRLRTSHRDTQV